MDDSMVVEQFLGVDVRFSPKSGKFSAWLKGGVEVVGKTVDEVEKAIAEKFEPKRVVQVVSLGFNPASPYFGMSEIKVPQVVQINGFNVDRGRGRGAQKSVEYTVSGGGTVSVKRALKRWNQEVADEMKAIVAEKKAADMAFLERARVALGKLEDISAEQIFRELNTKEEVVKESKIEDDVRRHLKVVDSGK